jgi:hypothetical protein
VFRYPRPHTRLGIDWSDDPNRPDADRVHLAIAALQAAAHMAASRDGNERLGLATDAATRLSLLRQCLPVGADASCEATNDGSVLIATRAGLLQDALYASYLPNPDAATTARITAIGDKKRGSEPLDGKTLQELASLRARLQKITLVLHSDRLRLRNSVIGIDVETSLPVRTDGPELPDEGLAFEVRHGALYDIFVRRSATPGGPRQLYPARIGVADFRKGEEEILLFLRYDPAGSQLELFIGTARLVIATEPKEVPDLALASQADAASRCVLPAAQLAEVIARIGRLGTPKNVTYHTGYMVGQGAKGIVALRMAVSNSTVLGIPAKLASPLGGIFRRLREGATIRTDGDHNYVEKGPTTVAFPIAVPIAHSIDRELGSMHSNGQQVRVLRQELLNGLLLGTAMAGDAAATLQLTLEFDNGPEPAIVQSIRLNRPHGVCTTTVEPINAVAQTCRSRTVAVVDLAIWSALLVHSSAEYIDLMIDGGRKIMVVTQKSGDSEIHTFFAAHKADRVGNFGNGINGRVLTACHDMETTVVVGEEGGRPQ